MDGLGLIWTFWEMWNPKTLCPDKEASVGDTWQAQEKYKII